MPPLERRRGRRAVRLVLALAAAGAAAWSLASVRGQLRLEPLEAVADRMLDNQTFDAARLTAIEPRLRAVEGSAQCGGRALAQAAIIRSYAAAIAEAQQPRPDLLDAAGRVLDRSLACGPRQAFLWYLRYWVGARRGEPAEALHRFLARSYALAPHEGWIARFRSEDALPFYPHATPELRARMQQEYLEMMRDAPARAALTFQNSAAGPRETLVSFMREAPLEQRRAIAELLDRINVVVDIPGIEYRDGRVYVPPRVRQSNPAPAPALTPAPAPAGGAQ